MGGFPALRKLLVGRGWVGAFSVVLMAAVFSLVAVVPAAAQVPLPDDDSFYAAPAGLADQANGSVLRSRQIQLYGLPVPVSARQIAYRSTDSSDRPVTDVATVLVPQSVWSGPNARPLLSYQVSEDSLDTGCAPSYALRGGSGGGRLASLVDSVFIAQALARGWAVVAADYEGPQSRYLDGVNSGRGVLDGIRAARALAADGLDPASPVGAWGYSGGSFATLWAAELQPSYAPDVRFAGVSAGGVPADLPANARSLDTGIQIGGGAVLMVLAVARNNPGNGVAALLNERGRALITQHPMPCGPAMTAETLGVHVDDLSTAPDLLSNPIFRAATDALELGRAAPGAPLYLYNSDHDEVVPVAAYSALIDRYCAGGADVTYRHSTAPTHIAAQTIEAPGALDYLADRFAGESIVRGCQPG